MAVDTLVPQTIAGAAAEADGDLMMWYQGRWQRLSLSAACAILSTAITFPAPVITPLVIDLGPYYKTGGHLNVNGTFTAAQVSKPTFMILGYVQPGKSLDEFESNDVAFSAHIESTTRMVVRWFSSKPVRGQVRVHYVIGS